MARRDEPWLLKRPGSLLRQLAARHSLAGPALLFALLDLEERLINSVRWRAEEPTPTDGRCWELVEIQTALRLAPKDVWVPQHSLFSSRRKGRMRLPTADVINLAERGAARSLPDTIST